MSQFEQQTDNKLIQKESVSLSIDNVQHQIIKERHKEILEIGKKTVELNEIYRDLSLLVVDQGEYIDNIESNINNAVIHTTRGVEEIKKAERNDRNSCIIL